MSRFPYRLAICLLIVALLTSITPCQSSNDAPVASAEAYVLLDADSGRVLLARNETLELPIASTTKIMTALVALEHAVPGETAVVKREHLREGSSMYLKEGETVTLEALLYGLMLPSGNDAAECIADCCGPGRDRFVARMNETARALGMMHTAFANPSGLDETGHYSCALDMARLMARAMRSPVFFRIASTRTADASGRTMQNHNRLLGAVDGCVGGKTGYTGAAGRTLVTCAERDGLRLIAVTLHDGNDWRDHAALYDYGFSTYRRSAVLRRGESCVLAAVRGGAAACVELAAAEDFFCALAKDETPTLRVEAPDSMEAPIREGQALGYVSVLLDGAELGRVQLRAASDVSAADAPPSRPFWARLRRSNQG